MNWGSISPQSTNTTTPQKEKTENGQKLLASARGTKGGMKVFWTEGSGRVRRKQRGPDANVDVVAVYCPAIMDGQLQQNCRPIHRSLFRCSALSRFSLSLSFRTTPLHLPCGCRCAKRKRQRHPHKRRARPLCLSGYRDSRDRQGGAGGSILE